MVTHHPEINCTR